MSRISDAFATRKALIAFLTAGRQPGVRSTFRTNARASGSTPAHADKYGHMVTRFCAGWPGVCAGPKHVRGVFWMHG